MDDRGLGGRERLADGRRWGEEVEREWRVVVVWPGLNSLAFQLRGVCVEGGVWVEVGWTPAGLAPLAPPLAAVSPRTRKPPPPPPSPPAPPPYPAPPPPAASLATKSSISMGGCSVPVGVSSRSPPLNNESTAK